jgi:ribonuclease P protein component
VTGPRHARTRPELREGLPPQRRVLRSGDFARIERQGVRASGPLLVLVARPRRDGKPGRIGFTISKKVGNAVVRNGVRRRLKELVRRRKHWLDARDLVVIARPEAAGASCAALHTALQALVEQVTARGAGRSRDEPPPKR